MFGAAVVADGRSVQITPKLLWYEYAVAFLPFIALLGGGAIGGALGALTLFAVVFTMRGQRTAVGKVLLGLFIGVAIVFLYYFVIGPYIVAALFPTK